MHLKNLFAGRQWDVVAAFDVGPPRKANRLRRSAMQQALRVLALIVAAALILGCSKDPQASSARAPSGAAGAPSSTQNAKPDPQSPVEGSDASDDVVGVIHYTGVINGTVRFHSSDCTVIEHSALPGPPFQGLDAPDTQSDESTHPPRLGVVPFGQRWHIMFNAPPSAADDPRKTVLMAVVEHGVKVVHHGDRWQVILQHVQLGDVEEMSTDLNKTKAGVTSITGSITCQRMN